MSSPARVGWAPGCRHRWRTRWLEQLGEPLGQGRAREQSSRWASAVLLLSLLVFAVAVGARAINRDSVPAVADEAGYYATSVAWYPLARSGGGRQLLQALLQEDTRPPLVQLVTAGVFAVGGEASLRVARLTLLLFLVTLLVSTYSIGQRLAGRAAGLLATGLLLAYPQVVGYSRIYWMDLPAAAMVALSLRALLATDGFARRGWAAVFGLTLGLAALTKYTCLVFLVGPTVYLALAGRRQREHLAGSRRWGVRAGNLALAAFVAATVAGPWYLPRLSLVWQNYVYNQGSGFLPAREAWTAEGMLTYLRHLLEVQIGPAFFAAFVCALPLFLRFARAEARSLLLIWLVVPFVFFTCGVLGMEWARFTLPYLAAVALITAIGILRFRFALLARAAAGGLGLLALVVSLRLSYGRPPAPPAGDFLWDRIGGPGMLRDQADASRLNLAALLPFPPADCRDAVLPRRGLVHVAVLPDHGSIASVLAHWAFEDELPLSIKVPYEPEGESFGGRFSYPERLTDISYLERFDYVIRVFPGEGVRARVRRPEMLATLEQLWLPRLASWSLRTIVRLPNGVRLAVLARPDRGERANGGDAASRGAPRAIAMISGPTETSLHFLAYRRTGGSGTGRPGCLFFPAAAGGAPGRSPESNSCSIGASGSADWAAIRSR